MKIVRVVGARPQFMQVPVLRDALIARGHEHILVHTGQHYDYTLSQGQMDDLQLGQPDYNLHIGSGPQGATTGRMIERIEALLKEIKPDLVVVDGDTNSTLAAAIAVSKMPIPLVHVEAGVRDFDRTRPEEINRIMTDHIADLNCAPFPRALDNLRKENLGARSILTGDVLLDCLCAYEKQADQNILKELALSGKFHVMTLHRPENTDEDCYSRFCDILQVLSQMDAPVIWPVHPRTQPAINKYVEEGHSLGSIRTVPALTYLQFLALVQRCDIVFTDSGGLSREAAWNGKRCVMLFRVDTLHDLLENDWATIGRTDRASIIKAIEATCRPDARAARAFFGNGHAAGRIAELIDKRFSDTEIGQCHPSMRQKMSL